MPLGVRQNHTADNRPNLRTTSLAASIAFSQSHLNTSPQHDQENQHAAINRVFKVSPASLKSRGGNKKSSSITRPRNNIHSARVRSSDSHLHDIRSPIITTSKGQVSSSRNERERDRVRLLNLGFERLRTVVPCREGEQLSKISTLKKAIWYIEHLDRVLRAPLSSGLCGAIDPDSGSSKGNAAWSTLLQPTTGQEQDSETESNSDIDLDPDLDIDTGTDSTLLNPLKLLHSPPESSSTTDAIDQDRETHGEQKSDNRINHGSRSNASQKHHIFGALPFCRDSSRAGGQPFAAAAQTWLQARRQDRQAGLHFGMETEQNLRSALLGEYAQLDDEESLIISTRASSPVFPPPVDEDTSNTASHYSLSIPTSVLSTTTASASDLKMSASSIAVVDNTSIHTGTEHILNKISGFIQDGLIKDASDMVNKHCNLDIPTGQLDANPLPTSPLSSFSSLYPLSTSLLPLSSSSSSCSPSFSTPPTPPATFHRNNEQSLLASCSSLPMSLSLPLSFHLPLALQLPIRLTVAKSKGDLMTTFSRPNFLNTKTVSSPKVDPCSIAEPDSCSTPLAMAASDPNVLSPHPPFLFPSDRPQLTSPTTLRASPYSGFFIDSCYSGMTKGTVVRSTESPESAPVSLPLHHSNQNQSECSFSKFVTSQNPAFDLPTTSALDSIACCHSSIHDHYHDSLSSIRSKKTEFSQSASSSMWIQKDRSELPQVQFTGGSYSIARTRKGLR
ncbi:unnamed protein product [Protopolystoma xenopodis]|uniref:BHLH domain-containing protein n=1 Tax=Protopolystoma xenopodis TaxID=117903 RepID=A0A3S4ZXR9_9PLAT|nr:unnamed protein product [Protopolystoma xenopodis]